MENKKSELKVKLNDLKISSFVTSFEPKAAKGGVGGTQGVTYSMGHTLCDNLDCTVVVYCQPPAY